MMTTPTILDVLDIFYGSKNVRLGVNRNPDDIYMYETMIAFFGR